MPSNIFSNIFRLLCEINKLLWDIQHNTAYAMSFNHLQLEYSRIINARRDYSY